MSRICRPCEGDECLNNGNWSALKCVVNASGSDGGNNEGKRKGVMVDIVKIREGYVLKRKKYDLSDSGVLVNYDSEEDEVYALKRNGGVESNYFPLQLPTGIATSINYCGCSATGGAGYGGSGFNTSVRATCASYPDGRYPGRTLCLNNTSECKDHIILSQSSAVLMPWNGNDGMYGIEPIYNSTVPFADQGNPTVTELMNWNIVCLNHLRRILGNPNPITLNDRLNYEALWTTERLFTDYYGARPTSSNAWQTISNTGFIPSVAQQESIYGVVGSTVKMTNDPPVVSMFGAANVGPYYRHLRVPSAVPWSQHIYYLYERYLRGQNLNSDYLITAFHGRAEIGMFIHRLNGTSDIFYRFAFAGPILNRCLI